MEDHGLSVFDISYNEVNGGSIRIFISYPRAFKKSEDVYIALEEEREYFTRDNLYNLYLRIMYYKKAIKSYIESISGDVYGLAASTKGNTLLQVLELDSTIIKAIGEVNEDKFGLRTVGTNIPIIPEKEVLEKNPELIIILAWHFKDTFDKVLKDYIKNGGRVLYPLPSPRVYNNKGVFYL
jgi:NDP-4-keto-2,6-dideoxyhexose 3-C-methyltransferase